MMGIASWIFTDSLAALRAIGAMLLKYLGPWSVVLPWLLPITGLFGMLGSLVALSDTMVTNLNTLATSLRGLPTSTLVAMANTVFPVSEGIFMIGALITLRVCTICVRMIKAWIPTLS